MKKEKNASQKGGFIGFLKSRRARHGALAAAITAVVIAVVIVLNVIVGLLVDRFPELKLDLTSNKAYELQDDTSDYLSHLKKDVTIYILAPEKQFESGNQYFVQAKNLLEKMISSSNGKLTLKYVDTSENPSFTKKYEDIDWTSNKNAAIVECGDQYKSLSIDECFTYDEQAASYYGYYEYTGTTIEQAVVTATLNVTTEDKVIVDFLTGNQEADFSSLKTLISNNAYQVNEINLLTSDIDKDASFVVLFAPAADIDEDTSQKLSEWLKNDGKYGKNLIYIANPDASTPNLDDFLAEWNMKLTDGYIFETSGDYLLNGVSQYAFITDYTDYYKDKLKNPNIPVIAYQARGVEVSDENTTHSILNTSSYAGIVPFDADDDWDYKDAVKGEPIAVAAESVKSDGEMESRVMVFGSYAMFSSGFISMNSANNSAFIMNIFNTVSEKADDSITIESKKLDAQELGANDETTANVIMVIFVIVIPVLILAAGIVVWIRRRNK